MKTFQRILTLLLAVLCLVAPAFAQTPRELVNKVVQNPGYDDQNCRGGGPPLPRGNLPLYGYFRTWADDKISTENFVALRAQRKPVLHEVAIQLDALNVQKATQDFRQGEVLLMIALDLNGVETLSALLRLEKAFDEVAYYRQRAGVVPRATESYSPHVQVLSIITAILKNEHAAGLGQLGKTARYDRAHRDLIVTLANRFLKTVDPSRYRRSAGMAAGPVIR